LSRLERYADILLQYFIMSSNRFEIVGKTQKNTENKILGIFFIHCESNGISSRVSVYFITEGVYHQSQAVFTFATMIG
jgi:hypothetical protein